MKYVIAIMLMLGVNAVIAQSAKDADLTRLENGEIKVQGTDALGADVFVVYSKELVKVYQERTVDNLTTFARFDNGQVVDYGSFNNPMVGNASAPVVVAEKD
ncbi:hypothetical protein N9545_05605 [Salibacteraceae bacterium]|nr:hypothetical protein [Salibacteraceae bacterium]MDB9710280.1 hypothetical protein [Salibacteraceae bacterium]MDC1304537.1 hypothetical protein [Salibacteraceae bacterium]